MDALAYKHWRQDVLRLIMFQWCVVVLLAALLALVQLSMGINSMIAGAAIAIPNTALGAWMGFRLLLGRVDPLGVILGSVVKTLLSLVLMGAGFAYLLTSSEIGWVWQGFFAGLVSVVFAPTVFGLVFKP